MPQDNYIRNLLNIKDQNITFVEDGVSDKWIKGKNCKVVEAKLSYIPKYCDKCGIIFESNNDFEKKGFDKGSMVVIPSICKMDSYLFLKKQRILCHHCNCSFVCRTELVNFGSFISTPTKLSIVVDLIKKRSEKDINAIISKNSLNPLV